MLIAIEGVDGCGKTTQVRLLAERLSAEGLDAHTVSFPRYADRTYGDLIQRYLRGDLGEVDQVHPRLVALLFAEDRRVEASNLRQALCEDKIVICDRYFYSNLAYQGSRVPEDELPDFTRWLRNLEFGRNAVPVPMCSLYLDVHQEERQERLMTRATLNSQVEIGAVVNDIHERDMSLQARVEEFFRTHAEIYDDLVRIDCQQYGKRLDAQSVHDRVFRVLTARNLLTPMALPPAFRG